MTPKSQRKVCARTKRSRQWGAGGIHRGKKSGAGSHQSSHKALVGGGGWGVRDSTEENPCPWEPQPDNLWIRDTGFTSFTTRPTESTEGTKKNTMVVTDSMLWKRNQSQTIEKERSPPSGRTLKTAPASTYPTTTKRR